ncbi:hypothetical protein [Lacisediminihabitans sp. H27-G8]|uniref:hypothetical protein n=1 Tax=Lacisediminihabitans sp. H27-G8 TaxID=3111909 RepID=UPI0038FBEF31
MSNVQYSTPATTMGAYYERSAWVQFNLVELLAPLVTPTRHLTDTEKSTLRVVVPNLADLPAGNSILNEAQYRLCLMEQRGWLHGTSGHELASILQRLGWPEHPAKLNRRGWEVLRQLDELDMVQIWISAEASLADPMHRRTMRLHARCLELVR